MDRLQKKFTSLKKLDSDTKAENVKNTFFWNYVFLGDEEARNAKKISKLVITKNDT